MSFKLNDTKGCEWIELGGEIKKPTNDIEQSSRNWNRFRIIRGKLIMIKCFYYCFREAFPLLSDSICNLNRLAQKAGVIRFPSVIISKYFLEGDFSPLTMTNLWWISIFMRGLYVNWMSIYIFPITQSFLGYLGQKQRVAHEGESYATWGHGFALQKKIGTQTEKK